MDKPLGAYAKIIEHRTDCMPDNVVGIVLEVDRFGKEPWKRIAGSEDYKLIDFLYANRNPKFKKIEIHLVREDAQNPIPTGDKIMIKCVLEDGEVNG